jgi:peptidoglycan/xylan/chitin deacetylase (PgdA/CDA1 family)
VVRDLDRMTYAGILDRLPGAFARRMAKWFGRRTMRLRPGVPIITFTFDDFPRSALYIGGVQLEHAGAAGTFFISRGLVGQESPTGQTFQAEDLPLLLSRGHELGCHTFHHCPAWETDPHVYALSVEQNSRSLAGDRHECRLQTHSYPISYPRPSTKRRIERRFRGCRGGGQTFNHGLVDLNYLNSYFLEQSRDNFSHVERTITANADASGWLIFSTHDISDHPTRFGCTPDFFERVIRASIHSGAKILVMSAGLDAVGVPPAPLTE